MLKRNLTKELKKEGKLFTPNVIDKVYESLGMSIVKADAKIEKSIKQEGEVFVPNVKENVYASVDAKPRNAFASFLLKPATLGVMSAALVAGVALAVVLPNLNKSIQAGESTEETPADVSVKTLNAPSTVNMKVISASESYSPAVMYTTDENGQVALNDIIALNNDGSNIINNLDTVFSNRAISSSYNIESFTSKYLSTALNLGYLERQDATKVNKIQIEFIYDEEDEEYFNSLVTDLNSHISSFVYENKVIAQFTCARSIEESDEADPETLALIRTAYELATKLFVTSDGKTVKVLCFSLDFKDWIEKYKETSKEELLDYIEFLKYIDEMISDDEMKAMFMSDLASCSLYQEAIDDIEVRYQSLLETYASVLEVFNERFSEHRPNLLPPLDGGWDWWDDFGHDHPHGDDHHGGPRPLYREPGHGEEPEPGMHLELEDYANLVSIIENENFEITQSMSKDDVEEVLIEIEYYCDALSMFFGEFNEVIEEQFEGLIYRVDNGDFIDNDRPPFPDHYQEEPEEWDDWFEDWWDEYCW